MEKTRLRNPKKDIMVQLKSLECLNSGSSDWHMSLAIYKKIEEGFKTLFKLEGKYLINLEQLEIKEGNITQSYDKYTLPPSIDKDGF